MFLDLDVSILRTLQGSKSVAYWFLTALSLDADLVLVAINVFARIDALTGFAAVRVQNVAVFTLLLAVFGLTLVN